MGERIAKPHARLGVPGRPGRYPWGEWTDGSTWRITRGADFDVSVDSMRSMLWSYAGRSGLDLATVVDGDSIEFRFQPNPDLPMAA